MPRTTIYLVVEQTWEHDEDDDYYYTPADKAYSVIQAYTKEEQAQDDAKERDLAALKGHLDDGDLSEWDENGIPALSSASRERFEMELKELGLSYDEDEDDIIWPEGHHLTQRQLEGVWELLDEVRWFRVEEAILIH